MRLPACIFVAWIVSSSLALGQAHVLTQHNSNSRNGAYLDETLLTPALVKNDFGLLYARNVKGFIYSQPLYTEIQFRGKPVKVFIVATTENWVYAFDASSTDRNPDASAVWSKQLPEKPGLPPQFKGCPLTTWSIGVTSTPVIDDESRMLYLVARDDKDGSHHLHGLNLNTGEISKSAMITYSRAAGDYYPGGPSLDFEPAIHLNRAGLLLSKGKVYVAFGAMCDRGKAHGWIFAYDVMRGTTIPRAGVFVSTPTSRSPNCRGKDNCYVEGGIWQSGNGLVADRDGYIYVTTGNGSSDASNHGNSFLKLRTGGQPNDLSLDKYFTPKNTDELSKGDVDLGSGGPLLLPGGRILGGGKQGKFYLLDADLHLIGSPDGSEGFQAFVNTWHPQTASPSQLQGIPKCSEEIDNVVAAERVRGYALRQNTVIPVQQYGLCQYFGPNIHGGPIYWKPEALDSYLVFGTAEKDSVKSFKYRDGVIEHTPYQVSGVRAPDGMPGGFLSLSASQGTNGIVWITLPVKDNMFWIQPGIMVALDALDLSQVLWMDASGKFAFAKFAPPTIAGGRVVRPTFGAHHWYYEIPFLRFPRRTGQLVVYGQCSTFPGRCEKN